MSNAPRDPRAQRSWGDDDSQTHILHVEMYSLFAQVELLENPQLRGRPVIVGGLSARGVVTSATYEARDLGVRAGMPIARARALCPTGVFVQGRHGVYSEYSRTVMGILSSYTPQMEQLSIDEAFLDVRGARRRLGSATHIARMIREQIREEVGLPASVGIAAVKSVAKIASSHAKPDGMLLIPAEATVDFLHALPVGALWGIGGKSAQLLEREGVLTIGQLARHPMSRLLKVLGATQAHHVRDLAWGIDPLPVIGERQEKSIGMERTFEENISDRSQLESFVVRAGYACAERLREAQMVCRTVSIKMRDAQFQTITRSMSLPVPTDLGREIARGARTLLDREVIPSGGVRLLGVRAENLQSRSGGVEVALDDDGRPQAVERVMDRVREKFGTHLLTPASLVERGTSAHGTESRGNGESH